MIQITWKAGNCFSLCSWARTARKVDTRLSRCGGCKVEPVIGDFVRNNHSTSFEVKFESELMNSLCLLQNLGWQNQTPEEKEPWTLLSPESPSWGCFEAGVFFLDQGQPVVLEILRIYWEIAVKPAVMMMMMRLWVLMTMMRSMMMMFTSPWSTQWSHHRKSIAAGFEIADSTSWTSHMNTAKIIIVIVIVIVIFHCYRVHLHIIVSTGEIELPCFALNVARLWSVPARFPEAKSSVFSTLSESMSSK